MSAVANNPVALLLPTFPRETFGQAAGIVVEFAVAGIRMITDSVPVVTVPVRPIAIISVGECRP